MVNYQLNRPSKFQGLVEKSIRAEVTPKPQIDHEVNRMSQMNPTQTMQGQQVGASGNIEMTESSYNKTVNVSLKTPQSREVKTVKLRDI